MAVERPSCGQQHLSRKLALEQRIPAVNNTARLNGWGNKITEAPLLRTGMASATSLFLHASGWAVHCRRHQPEPCPRSRHQRQHDDDLPGRQLSLSPLKPMCTMPWAMWLRFNKLSFASRPTAHIVVFYGWSVILHYHSGGGQCLGTITQPPSPEKKDVSRIYFWIQPQLNSVF